MYRESGYRVTIQLAQPVPAACVIHQRFISKIRLP